MNAKKKMIVFFARKSNQILSSAGRSRCQADMLFLAPPSHLSATLSTLPTLPQHAVTQAVRRDADDYALVPHYAFVFHLVPTFQTEYGYK